MDVINKGLTQIGDLFKSLSPGMRMVTALLFAAIVISLGFLMTNRYSGGDDYLLGGIGFTAHELPAMEAAFGKASLSDYTVEGNRIRVARSRHSTYMAALADGGALPAHFGDHLAKATNNTTVFTSAEQRVEMLKVAKQQELAQIIRSMQGIESAAVLYDSQKKGGLRPSTSTTASVSVKASGTRPLDGNQVAMIRHLVAGAIAGLSPNDVTVSDLNSGRTYAHSGGPDGAGNAIDDPYLARKREYQKQFIDQVLNALSHVPGVSVSVNVELSKELRKSVISDKVDPKQTAPIQSREISSTSSQTTSSPAGRPGVAAQGANAPAALAQGPGNESTEERTETDTTNLPSKEQSRVDLVGLTPERVTVAIGVPMKYMVDVWKLQNPAVTTPPDKAALEAIEKLETDKIRKHVENQIPKPATTDATTPLVTVTTFSNVADTSSADVSIASQAMYWLTGNWSTLAVFALVIVSLRMLLNVAKPAASGTATEPSAAATGAVLNTVVSEDEPALESGEDKPRRLRRKLGTGPSLRDELVEMVKEDPEAAANVLRGWIGSVN